MCDSEESDGVKTERRRHLSRPPSYQKWGGLSMPRRTSDEECEVERFSSSDDSRDNNIEDAFEKGVNKGKASVIGIKGKN